MHKIQLNTVWEGAIKGVVKTNRRTTHILPRNIHATSTV